jgi:hypothetical protein
MVEARSGNRVNLVRKRKGRIQDNSQVTNRRGEVDVGKSEMKGISINLIQLKTTTKPYKLGLVRIQPQAVRGEPCVYGRGSL